MQDPAYEFEQKEIDIGRVARIIQAILKLPVRQRYAVACTLNDQLDNVRPFVAIFKAFGIDIETARWPEGREERQSLKTSLSISRKKLRLFLS